MYVCMYIYTCSGWGISKNPVIRRRKLKVPQRGYLLGMCFGEHTAHYHVRWETVESKSPDVSEPRNPTKFSCRFSNSARKSGT